jgi:HEAT repeat protein
MIQLCCPQCQTKVPVSEEKIGKTLFVCPTCSFPLETPGGASAEMTAPLPPGAFGGLPPSALGTMTAPMSAPMSPTPSPAPMMPPAMEISSASIQPPPPPPLKPLARTSRKNSDPDKAPRAPALAALGKGRGFLIGAGAAVGTAVLAGILFLAFGPKRTSKPSDEQADPAPMSILDVLALSEDLKSDDKETRAKAALALGKAGKEARAALPALLEALRDEDEKIRDLVADALDQAGPPAKEDFPAISTALRDEDPDVRSYAVSALDELGEDAWGEIEQVRELTKDTDPNVRAAAEKTLARLEKEMLESLTKRLKDPNPDVRREAADRLSDLGGANKEAADKAAGSLMAAMSDENEAVRVAVSKALTDFGNQVVPMLAEALRNRNQVARRMAIASLGNMGADAIEAVPDLAGIVDDANVGAAAAAVLANNFGDLAVPGIATVLASPTIVDNRRLALQNVLVRIGPAALPAITYYVGRYPGSRVYFGTVINQLNVLPPAGVVWGVPVDPFARAYYWDYVNRFNAWLDLDRKFLNLEKARLGLKMDEAAFKAFLKRVDRDGDGRISKAEYERWAHDHAKQLAKEDQARKALQAAQKNLHNNVATTTKAAQDQAKAIVRNAPKTVAKNTDQRAAAEASLRRMRTKAAPQNLKAQQDLINKQRALTKVQRHAPAAKSAPAPTKRMQPRQPPPQRPVAHAKPPTRKPVVHRPPPPPRGGGGRHR